MKAKKIFTYYEKDRGYTDVIMVYKYRDYEYEVVIKGNGYYNPLHQQHEYEQKRIDDIIEMKNKKPDPKKAFNLDEIFEMLNWD